MTWAKPKQSEPSSQWFITSGPYFINKALVHGAPIYQLSRAGVLLFTGGLDECKRRANEDCKPD